MTKCKNNLFLVVAIALMLVSMIGASLVQTGGGSVKVTEVSWVGSDGYQRSGWLLKPKTATAENAAPAVVTSHGFLNNRGMQDLNFVELSRRGFVVLAIDMTSHGDSEITPSMDGMMNSVWEGVSFLADINYVDNTRIGVTGHSFGGFSSNFSVRSDEANGSRYVAAVLVNSMDPNYDTSYGNRDVGVVAGQYDEFAFNITDEKGVAQPKPDFINSKFAQTFLNFGIAPAGTAELKANTVYTKNIDGRDAIRVIYTHNIIHPWSHFSARSTKATIEFFDASLKAPNPIDSSNQVWQWKVFFNILGIIGFVMFVVTFTTVLLRLPFFKSVKRTEISGPAPARGKQWWFWVSLALAAAFGTIFYLPIMQATKAATFAPTFLDQSAVRGISVWAACCGLFTILLMFATKFINKEEQIDLAATGIKISLVNLLKTILLAITVVISSYLWVFMADYLFQVDFRVWVLAINRFNPVYIRIAIPFILISSVFYIASSISVNCFNYRKIAGKEWLNTLILAVATGLPALIVTLIQYTHFYRTGFLAYSANQTHLMIVWLFPLVAILPISVIVARKIYKKTGNPYLPGIINAIIVSLISCANTCTFF